MSETSVIIRCNECQQLNRVPREKLASRPVCGNCKVVLDIPRAPVWAKVENFDRMVSYWPETLLVVFTAPMCLYSKIMEPVVNTLAREKTGMLKVVKVDIESASYLAQRFKIEKTPTFIVYKNSVQVIRVDGPPKDKTDLVTWIENLINYNSY